MTINFILVFKKKKKKTINFINNNNDNNIITRLINRACDLMHGMFWKRGRPNLLDLSIL